MNRHRTAWQGALPAFLLLLFLALIFLSIRQSGSQEKEMTEEIPLQPQPQVEEAPSVPRQGDSLYAGTSCWLSQCLSKQDRQMLREAFALEDEEVYSFLQGPKSWKARRPWSGSWCRFRVEGNPFGGFGCGLCCMANIYNTLSPYEVSPLDMYDYARAVSNYSPSGAVGAIDWRDMRDSLKNCGFSCKLYKKPGSFQRFKKQIAKAKSAIVLVSSYEDDAYWQDTPGHYVNIWLYREEDGTVFLAEPGDPDKNRSRISLRYVYDALNTSNQFQYLTVKGYTEEANQWKADGISVKWKRPKG